MRKKSPIKDLERFYALEQTPAGWVGLLASREGLVGCSLPQASRDQAFATLGLLAQNAQPDPGRFKDLTIALLRYFEGQKLEFSCPLDLRGASDFERAVWKAARSIPYGKTRSYAWIAGQIGKPGGSRAVGQALGKNPLPIFIPCHRVLKSDGGLGGFSGGLEMKSFLLKLEGSNP